MKCSIITTVVLTLLLTGCGSTGKKDMAQIKKVKKVGVLSFVIYQDKPADNTGLGALFNGSKSIKETQGNNRATKKFASDAYEELTRNLSKTLNKKVLSRQQVLRSNSYKAFHKEKSKGLRYGAMDAFGKQVAVFDEKIFDDSKFLSLSFTEKARLAKKMGLDAFIEYKAFQQIKQGWGLGNIIGTGSFQLITKSNITMYSVDSEKPIWSVRNLSGGKSRSSKELGKKVSQLNKLAIIGLESAQSSMEKMSEKFN